MARGAANVIKSLRWKRIECCDIARAWRPVRETLRGGNVRKKRDVAKRIQRRAARFDKQVFDKHQSCFIY